MNGVGQTWRSYGKGTWGVRRRGVAVRGLIDVTVAVVAVFLVGINSAPVVAVFIRCQFVDKDHCHSFS